MAIRLLLVDDSAFFIKRLQQMLKSCIDIEVVGVAANGLEAISLARKLRPDVISMDYAMPVLDGLQAVKAIMRSNPTKIVMLSSLSVKGAQITLDALNAGAVDFFAKTGLNGGDFKAKIRAVAGSSNFASDVKSSANLANSNNKKITSNKVKTAINDADNLFANISTKFKVVIIAASTGGPVAVQRILQQLPPNFALPIVLIQHMPAAFSAAFAERLNESCALQVFEAKNGDTLQAGKVLIAPGGKQLVFTPQHSIKIIESNNYSYQPCADLTFTNAAKIFGNEVLALVLTGMGQDGASGAQILKQKGAQIWAQNEASCMIYGMPAAVIKAKTADQIYNLDELAQGLIQVAGQKEQI